MSELSDNDNDNNKSNEENNKLTDEDNIIMNDKNNNINNNDLNDENNINENLEDDDIDSTNNIMNDLTFGCSNSSFKTPQVNTINFDTNSNRKITENNDSDVAGISDEYKNIQSLTNKINNIGEENIINRINTLNSLNNEDKNSNINKSLRDLFRLNKNKNDIISIHSTKNDLTSNGSNYIFRNDNQSLNDLLSGNRNKNDIISLNSNFTYNETESVNQSLINFITNRNNDIVSLKSNDLVSKKENMNLQEMFEDFETKSKIEQINKKISKSGFIHIYEDSNKNKENKEYKHVQIIDESGKNEGEKLFIYQNDGITNKYEKYKIPKKDVIDQSKYYEILLHNNKKINNKVHRSNFFPRNTKKKK